jgi:tRNA threonylcarbamoyladenosine biosynthesis protein TsaE
MHFICYHNLMEVVVQTVADTHGQARKFLDSLAPDTDRATVVGFVGPLGAGKTEFIRGLLQSAGVTDPITSPTYTIETVYELPESEFERAYHIDAYRLEGADDLADIGFEDRLKDEEGLILIEWADRVKDILPAHAINIPITSKEDRRVITIENEQGE